MGSLHAAAFDDAHWPATSGLIDEALGSRGSILVIGDGMRQAEVQVFLARFCFRGERRADLEQLCFSAYHPQDETLPRARQAPVGEVVQPSSLYTEEEKKTSLAYNEGLPLLHLRKRSGYAPRWVGGITHPLGVVRTGRRRGLVVLPRSMR